MTARRSTIAPLFVLLAAILVFTLQPALTKPPQVKPWKLPPQPIARYCVLYDFGTRPNDPLWQNGPIGNIPAAIADGHDGYLYTTSAMGGRYGQGTVFRVSPVDGKPPEVLHDFTRSPDDGSGPFGGLTRGDDGAFYGTTYLGGKYGEGTVFRITSKRDFSVIWHFRNGAVYPPPVNRQPSAQELLDAAGSVPVSAPVALGTSLYGVARSDAVLPYGVLYRITHGEYHGVHTFDFADVAANGSNPMSLSVGAKGILWGVTSGGGLGYGTVFKFQGGVFSTVYKFKVAENGSLGVIEGPNGKLYGVAMGLNTYGMVYELNPDTHTLKPIHSFTGADGAYPLAELTLGQDGKLYGVTTGGGSQRRGVVFSMNVDGNGFATLFNMDMDDGRKPVSPLLETSKDNFYGITDQGGTQDSGVFYHVATRMYPPPAHDSFYPPGAGSKLVAQDSTVSVQTDQTAWQGSPAQLMMEGGVLLTLGCARDPHIAQFVYRMEVGADGKPKAGTYSLSWGTFQFTTNPGSPTWHTDAIGYPNAYYDQAPGASHVVRTGYYAQILDAPGPFAPDASWQVTAKDFCICNCKVVRVVNWTRGGHYDVKMGRTPAQYTNISIEAPPVTDTNWQWSDTQMQWINRQLVKDGYDIILPN